MILAQHAVIQAPPHLVMVGNSAAFELNCFETLVAKNNAQLSYPARETSAGNRSEVVITPYTQGLCR